MKLEAKHNKLLSDEFQDRYMSADFPDEINILLDEIPETKVKSVIHEEQNTVDEDPVLESIILAYNRPSFIIKESLFDPSPSDTWKDVLTPHINNLSSKISAVGRIEMKNHVQLDWAGTGFLVDENIIVTNRHVANHFVDITPSGYSWKINSRGRIVKGRIDFAEEHLIPLEIEIEFEEILYIEPIPGPDIALFRVNVDLDINPLELSSSYSGDDIIVTIGYPWKDTRVSFQIEDVMRRIFGDIYDVKRLAPGKILQADDPILRHDCTTVGGNSGSAILDLETGKVVAIHYSGDVSHNNAVSAKAIKDCLTKI
jgi:endonuclease G